MLTGSAIGSNLGQFFKLDQRTLMLLVGHGAAARVSLLLGNGKKQEANAILPNMGTHRHLDGTTRI